MGKIIERGISPSFKAFPSLLRGQLCGVFKRGYAPLKKLFPPPFEREGDKGGRF